MLLELAQHIARNRLARDDPRTLIRRTDAWWQVVQQCSALVIETLKQLRGDLIVRNPVEKQHGQVKDARSTRARVLELLRKTESELKQVHRTHRTHCSWQRAVLNESVIFCTIGLAATASSRMARQRAASEGF